MSNSGKGFAIGLITGVATGTAIAFYLHPIQAKIRADDLSYQLNSYLKSLRSLIEQLKMKKKKFHPRQKQDSDKVIEDAKERADGLIKEAESLLENIEKSGK